MNITTDNYNQKTNKTEFCCFYTKFFIETSTFDLSSCFFRLQSMYLTNDSYSNIFIKENLMNNIEFVKIYNIEDLHVYSVKHFLF